MYFICINFHCYVIRNNVGMRGRGNIQHGIGNDLRDRIPEGPELQTYTNGPVYELD